MVTAEDGATFKTELKEALDGWEASFRITSNERVISEVKVLPSKADAVTWLTAEATAHGFVYEPPV
jgi:hypothetical protein